MNFFKFLGIKQKPNAPWKKYYKKSDMSINSPNVSIYRFIRNKAKESNYDNNIAITYFNNHKTYKEFFKEIYITSRAFKSQGIRKGDVVTIISANIPEALISFYALNKIGAVANILHPLLSENEIKTAIKEYKSVLIIAIDFCYSKIKNIIDETNVYKVIIISPKDSMKSYMKIAYYLTKGRKIEKPFSNEKYMYWQDFLSTMRTIRMMRCSISIRMTDLMKTLSMMTHSSAMTNKHSYERFTEGSLRDSLRVNP